MEIIGGMKYYTEEEALTRLYGEVGTPERDEVEEEIKRIVLGATLRQAREEQSLTQEQLAEMVGLKPIQITHIENGKNKFTFGVLSKLCRALGIKASVDLDIFGKVALV